MRWLTPIILIVVLLTAACGHDPGGKDKIAVIDWDKAFIHASQSVLCCCLYHANQVVSG